MKKFKNYAKGFTLIELLVVIAIIGILSSVVLVSLNSARQKGKDARVQAEVAQIRAALEAEYDGKTYPSLTIASNSVTTATLSANMTTLTGDIVTTIGGSAFPNTNSIIIYSSSGNGLASNYGIYAVKPSGGYTCLDSYGNTNPNGTGNIPAYASITAPATKLCQ